MRLPATIALVLAPAAAMADTMPQMDFHNPLTWDQVFWMVVILVALYFALSRWGLPEIGKVLENRAQLIARDLAAARRAKTEADLAVAALNATMAQARQKAQTEVAEMIAKAKSRAAANSAALAERLDRNMAEAEARIDAARAEAMQALKPVAESAALAMLRRLTGGEVNTGAVSARVDDALAAAKVN
jgi:F-type H+-transporting ATPase subunit b